MLRKRVCQVKWSLIKSKNYHWDRETSGPKPNKCRCTEGTPIPDKDCFRHNYHVCLNCNEDFELTENRHCEPINSPESNLEGGPENLVNDQNKKENPRKEIDLVIRAPSELVGRPASRRKETLASRNRMTPAQTQVMKTLYDQCGHLYDNRNIFNCNYYKESPCLFKDYCFRSENSHTKSYCQRSCCFLKYNSQRTFINTKQIEKCSEQDYHGNEHIYIFGNKDQCRIWNTRGWKGEKSGNSWGLKIKIVSYGEKGDKGGPFKFSYLKKMSKPSEPSSSSSPSGPPATSRAPPATSDSEYECW